MFSCEFCEISKKSGKIQAANQKIKIEIQNSKQQTKNHKHNLKFTNYAFYHINYHTNYHAIITQIIAHIKFTNYKFKPPTSKLKVKSPEKSAFIIQKWEIENHYSQISNYLKIVEINYCIVQNCL